MEEKNAILHGGFDNPVFDSQSVFRAVMDGMAEPGTIRQIEAETLAPEPVGPAMSAVLLALADADTPVWLTSTLSATALKSWLSFHCGAKETEEKALAGFAVIEKNAAIPSFELFATGSQEYPDRSTTLIIELPSFEGGETITLSGPGISGTRAIAPQGLPPHFLARWAGNRASFPRGIDIIFTCGRQLFCLSRSTTITA
ncbi:phosphonate C-P lyase system protein PhnH [Martelella mediterranea]|uniref:Alpha-D-ribose 1-methylphosphonate 5-triphosphate synthase subunit PhnH n=1 Tax=Martelella mediterranea TaxID=293089 RepID=A0A4R3NYE2_9HYPH|nr:phosphonate C-P lyase system protein PhnH [Martelella mediterranea]TCT44985.1 alpha-D-ribose 1-methylphosphonate 5-triphosphate synthase subunit PhnH [Martelella mediterranea]